MLDFIYECIFYHSLEISEASLGVSNGIFRVKEVAVLQLYFSFLTLRT